MSEDFDQGYAVGLATRESVFQLREQRDDLLAALQALKLGTCWCLGGNQDHDEACLQAQAAIARATGGTP